MLQHVSVSHIRKTFSHRRCIRQRRHAGPSEKTGAWDKSVESYCTSTRPGQKEEADHGRCAIGKCGVSYSRHRHEATYDLKNMTSIIATFLSLYCCKKIQCLPAETCFQLYWKEKEADRECKGRGFVVSVMSKTANGSDQTKLNVDSAHNCVQKCAVVLQYVTDHVHNLLYWLSKWDPRIWT